MFKTLALLSLAGAALAAPSKTVAEGPSRLQARSVVACSPTQTAAIVCVSVGSITPFAQSVPSGTEGSLYLQRQPYLYVIDGCVPYPAVDATGETDAGLTPSGAPNGGCSSSTGQVYARATSYEGKYAIMYSWYMPKDEPSEAEALLGVGHRYDWEGVVVFLASESTSAALLGVAASYHGDYQAQVAPALSGTRPLISYYSEDDVLDHSCGFTTTVGGSQPLIAYEELPAAALTALEDKDWGSGNVPFIDINFENNLALAYSALQSA